MDIVKRVDLSMNDKGKLNVFENPKGNYELIRTNLTKMDIRTHSEFALFLNRIFPINFRVEYVWFREKKLVVKYNNVLFTEFFVELTDKGVAGYKKLYENDDNKYQIFYYVVDNPVNSISLLSKIIETVQVGLTKEQVKQMVTAVLPEVSEVDFYDKNNNDFLIKIPLNEELCQYKWNKFDSFVIRIHNSHVEFLGEYDYGSDESWENEHIETILDKKHELDLYKQRIKRIEDKIEVMEYIQDQLLKCSFNFSKFEIEFTPVEPISLEVQDKIRRKKEAEVARQKERNPILMKKGHHYLLMMIQSARLTGRYHDRDGQFTLEEIKAELSHRPHIPKGKEGKERRKLLSQGKIQK